MNEMRAGTERIRLRFGESVSEACAELGENNATNGIQGITVIY